MMIPITVLVASAQAASVTVRPGDDLNALTQSLNAGDVVTFTAGTYETEGTLDWSGLGTDVAPIRFVAEAGAQVVLRNIGEGYVANLSDSEYVEITGLIFEGGPDLKVQEPSGLRISNSNFVTVEDCVVRNVWGTAMRLDNSGTNLTIRRNEFGPSLDGPGFFVGTTNGSAWIADSLIANNVVHDVNDAAMEFRAGTQNVVIEHNVIYRAGTGVILPDTQFGEQNVLQGNAIWQIENDALVIRGPALVQSNVIFEIGDEGIVTVGDDALFDVQISHNTIVRTDGWGAELNGWYNAPDMVFANNAISNSTGRSLQYFDDLSLQDPKKDPVPDTENFIANNVVTGLINGFDRLVRPTWVIEGGGVIDFVDIDNFDFYPAPGSQLLDAGTPDGNAFIPFDDFNGAQRNGARPDAGAYEHDVPGNPGWLIQEGFKDLGDAGNRGGETISRGCCNNSDGGTRGLVFVPLVALGALLRRRRKA